MDEQLAKIADRALFIAEHLLQMIPDSVWRENYARGPGGEYEGDYLGMLTQREIRDLRAQLDDLSGMPDDYCERCLMPWHQCLCSHDS